VGTLGQPEADALVKQAVEAGVNFIDTANMYSAGRSEEILGRPCATLGLPRESLVLATKVRTAVGKGPNDLGAEPKAHHAGGGS
jgi:aryl-alcohol dehydrogenase-like predicted oxidoreductase